MLKFDLENLKNKIYVLNFQSFDLSVGAFESGNCKIARNAIHPSYDTNITVKLNTARDFNKTKMELQGTDVRNTERNYEKLQRCRLGFELS